MGMQEYLLEKAKTKGVNLGLEKGRLEERARAEAEKRAKERDVIRNLIITFANLSDDSIASIAVADVSLVADVRKELTKK